MITEDYVSFELAKLLNIKGFKGEFHKHYWGYEPGKEFLTDSSFNPEYDYPAPTLQMAVKWLREVHNQIIVPGISLDDRTSGTINHYFVGIWYIPKNNGGAFCYTSPTPYKGYQSYEEACEAAIKYCLENLI